MIKIFIRNATEWILIVERSRYHPSQIGAGEVCSYIVSISRITLHVYSFYKL